MKFIGKDLVFSKKQKKQIYSPRSSKYRVHILSSLYAISSSVFFFAMAALISLGATLVNQNVITFEDFFM